ncbi:MAG: hypothetical protein OHK005_09670 [Candidatus Methylacidiphilales bacterium]
MPSLALSTSCLSRHHTCGRAMLEQAAALGFDKVELGHGIPFSLWPGVLNAVRHRVVQVTSVHNFCPVPVGCPPSPNVYEFSDPAPRRRARAVAQTLETLDSAATVQARAVVLHLGSMPRLLRFDRVVLDQMKRGRWGSRAFCRAKVQAVAAYDAAWKNVWPRVRDCLLELAEPARQRGLKLGLENREIAAEFPLDDSWEAIMAELPEDVFGHWHDFGHAARKEAAGYLDHAALLRSRASRLIGCHLHDFSPPNHDHLLPGKGSVNFLELWPLLPCETIFVLELSPRTRAEDIQSWRPWWNQHGPVTDSAFTSSSS